MSAPQLPDEAEAIGGGNMMEGEEEEDDLALLMAIGESDMEEEAEQDDSDTDEAQAAAEALAEQMEDNGPASGSEATPLKEHSKEGEKEEDEEDEEDNLALLLSLHDEEGEAVAIPAIEGTLPSEQMRSAEPSQSIAASRPGSQPRATGAFTEEVKPRRARPSQPAAAFVQVGGKKPHSSSVLQPADSKANKMPGGTQHVYKGLKVKKPTVSSVIVSEKLEEAGYVTLANLQKQKEPPASWATMAVLSSKSKTKSSSSGKPFMVVKLTDLQQNFTSLFLFGSAYKDFWMEPEGTVVAVFSAKVRVESDGSKSLSADSVDQILKVGTSPDFGWCKGTRKDGSKCTMPVNVRECEWCHFHAAEALKRLQSKRPGFVNTGITRDYKRLNNTLRNKVMGSGFGSGLRPDGIKHTKEKRPMEPAKPRDSVPGTKSSMGAKFLNASLKQQQEANAAQLAKLAKKNGQKKPEGKPGVSDSRFPVETKEHSRGPDDSRKQTVHRMSSNPHPPRPSKGFVDLDGDSDDDADGAKARARAIIMANGGMEAIRRGARFSSLARKSSGPKQQPGKDKATEPSSEARALSKRSSQLLGRAAVEQLRAKKAKNDGAGKDGGPKDPVSGFAAAFGAVVDGMSDNLESRYKSEADFDDDDAIAKTLAFAEQKDKAATHLEGVKEITVTAWNCQNCNRLLDGRRDSCKSHNGSWQKVTKRFFACGNCNRRETTLNRRIPNHKCNFCKANTWNKSGMRQEYKSSGAGLAPKAVVSREDLKPRGHEHAFSLQQNLSLER